MTVSTDHTPILRLLYSLKYALSKKDEICDNIIHLAPFRPMNPPETDTQPLILLRRAGGGRAEQSEQEVASERCPS
jgi:hypothetical protein